MKKYLHSALVFMALTPLIPTASAEVIARESFTTFGSSLPSSWVMSTYGDGAERSKPVITPAAKDDPEAGALIEYDFKGDTYWGMVLSSPALSASSATPPLKATFKVYAEGITGLSLGLIAQDANYKQLAKLEKSFKFETPGWYEIESAFQHDKITEALAAGAPYLVVVLRLGNEHGVAPGQVSGFAVKDFVLSSQ